MNKHMGKHTMYVTKMQVQGQTKSYAQYLMLISFSLPYPQLPRMHLLLMILVL